MIDILVGYLEKEGKSENTIKSYTRHVEGYLKWFDESKGTVFTKLHRENVKDYISFLRTVKKDNPRTINAKISGLIKFNEFLVDSSIQTDIVVSKKDNLRIQQNYASLAKVENKDVEKFRQLILDNEKSRRNFAIVTIMAYAGLRISEALNITLNDFNLVTKELVVQDGKGSKARTVFLNDKIVNSLKQWIKERKGMPVDSTYLFVSNRGKPVDRTVINKVFKKYSELIGKEITPHDLRHHFCSLAIDKGLSIHEVANQAGHSNIHTTLIYANPSKDELKNKMNLL